MYYYELSEGLHSEYYEITLYHETEWTKEQFGEMINVAVDHGNTRAGNVAEYLMKHYGFKGIEPTIRVICEVGEYRKFTSEDYQKEGNELDADGYYES